MPVIITREMMPENKGKFDIAYPNEAFRFLRDNPALWIRIDTYASLQDLSDAWDRFINSINDPPLDLVVFRAEDGSYFLQAHYKANPVSFLPEDSLYGPPRALRKDRTLPDWREVTAPVNVTSRSRQNIYASIKTLKKHYRLPSDFSISQPISGPDETGLYVYTVSPIHRLAKTHKLSSLQIYQKAYYKASLLKKQGEPVPIDLLFEIEPEKGRPRELARPYFNWMVRAARNGHMNPMEKSMFEQSPLHYSFAQYLASKDAPGNIALFEKEWQTPFRE